MPLVLTPTEPLIDDEQKAFEVVLAPLGVRAKGRQGDELVIEVLAAATPDNFYNRVFEALSSEPASAFWARYKSVSYI